ncbi:hypothetical protein LR48_Vigan11g151500 [Vigna angularis]|uniref:Uncharacterized protein n=1 Tax=Phaseolus angularis TaxID=3914 RepID=A0A0L9VTT4_PHAAN|nr:hypothetical protein LR48_Vigan11g151500 [Vigna angularis]
MYRANQSKHMQEDARRQRERSSSSRKRENRTLVQSRRADARPRQKSGRSSRQKWTLVQARQKRTLVQARQDARPLEREFDVRLVSRNGQRAEDARPVREEALVHRGARWTFVHFQFPESFTPGREKWGARATFQRVSRPGATDRRRRARFF